MSARFVDKKTLPLLLGTVLVLAGPVLWSWFAPFVDGSASPTTFTGKAVRGIASIATSPEEQKDSRLSHPITLEWDPSKSALTKEVDGTHLRLKGVLKNARLNHVTNQTNGFTASVFTNDDSYSTDFIELREGQNEIKVEAIDGRGRKITRVLQVTRTPASTFEP